jgi:hypothetical protein
MNQKIKQIIIAFIVIVVALIGFKTFFPNLNSGGEALVVEEPNSPVLADGQAILVLLGQLNRVTLDDSIFSNPIFTSLISFEKPIQEQAVGRPNPFLPIGVDNVSGVVIPSASSTIRAN